MQRNNPHDHQSIGSKNARAASRAPRKRTQIKAAAARPGPVLVGPAPTARLRLLEGDSAYRKEFPITRGLLDYFPDACAAVAQVSFLGNEKHNPGQPMHHARGKSMDHADCIARHLTERGGFDVIVVNGVERQVRHSVAMAWRALALAQEELEQEFNLPLPRAAKI